jgi:hypothetical protein
MQMIVTRKKNHEFRTKHYPSARRIWFYETSPVSAITYICEVGQAVIRGSQGNQNNHGNNGSLLKDDGIGNTAFNNHHPDYKGYDYAYPILSCWRVTTPVTLGDLRAHGIKGAPRGMVYVNESLLQQVKWDERELVWK